jgi:hypothetical protein
MPLLKKIALSLLAAATAFVLFVWLLGEAAAQYEMRQRIPPGVPISLTHWILPVLVLSVFGAVASGLSVWSILARRARSAPGVDA